jgi:hypothetical protein
MCHPDLKKVAEQNLSRFAKRCVRTALRERYAKTVQVVASLNGN